MSKGAIFFKLLQDVRASYWFLPSVLVCLAFVLSQVTLYLDQHSQLIPFELPRGLRDTQVDGARSLMAIISQSVFGVAGVMFSMTIVAVSFASGNFGPRLIGNFMRDRGNQLSLGILVATFVYALMITRAIQSPTGEDASLSTELFVPHLSIAIALGLTFVSIFTVIYFVHHIPETINVSNITAGLGKRLVNDIKALIDKTEDENLEPVDIPSAQPGTEITLQEAGYIQTMNIEQLHTVAKEHSLIIDVRCPVGEFVSHDSVVLHVWGDSLSDEVCKVLRSSFALGHSPTENQNLLFVVDQLVEMIARAMSPGVNDPFTAINCLNWLQAATVMAANYSNGLQPPKLGPVHTPEISFSDLLAAAFEASWHYAKTDPLCERHFRAVLSQMAQQIEPSEFLEDLRTFSDKIE